MAEITAATVKELRERTGAGMMDCKKALGETSGDMEAAIDWLRTKGLAAPPRRPAAPPPKAWSASPSTATKGAVVEVNSRDRLRRQERPVPGFVRTAAELALEHRQRHRGAEGRLLAGRRHRRGEADQQHRDDRREPVDPPRRRARGRRRASSPPTCTMRRRPASARSACSSRWRATATSAALEALGKQLAMHIAAANPLALTRRGARPGAGRARARDRHARRPPRAASPPRSSRRWSRARSAKFRKENALLCAALRDGQQDQVEDVVAAAGKDAGAPVTLKAFVRFQLGEGIEKKAERLRRRSRRRRGHRAARRRSPDRTSLAAVARAALKVRRRLHSCRRQIAPRSPMPRPRFKRILLKLSGEALMGEGQFGIDPDTVARARRGDQGGGRRRPSSSAWSSAAATSSAASPAPPRASTAPAPTIWACWRR